MPAPPFSTRVKNVAAPPNPLDRIRQAGLIAQLPGALLVAEQLTVGDALLATPWPIIAVTLEDANAFVAITQLRQRFGQHMLIGAHVVDPSPHETLSQLRAALAADAQFVITNAVGEPVLMRLCQQWNVLYVPSVTTEREAEVAAALGCPVARFGMPADSTFERVQALSAFLPLLVAGDFTEAELAAAAQASALAALITPPNLPPAWSMARFITAARSLRAAWNGALSQ